MCPELTMKVMVHESETYTKVGNDEEPWTHHRLNEANLYSHLLKYIMQFIRKYFFLKRERTKHKHEEQ